MSLQVLLEGSLCHPAVLCVGSSHPVDSPLWNALEKPVVAEVSDIEQLLLLCKWKILFSDVDGGNLYKHDVYDEEGVGYWSMARAEYF
jgi:hypothetical protein